MKHESLRLLLVRLLRPCLLSIACFSAVINLLMLVPSLYMLQIYDRVLGSGNLITLLMLTLLLVGLLLLCAALEQVRQGVLFCLAEEFELSLAPRLYDAAFRQRLVGRVEAKNGVLDDLNTLRHFIGGPAPTALLDLPWFPLYLMLLYAFHPWLGHFALAATLLLLVLAWCHHHWSARLQGQAILISMAATHQFHSQLERVESAEVMGCTPGLRERWFVFHEQFIRCWRRGQERSAMAAQLAKVARIVVQSCVLGLGAVLVIHGEIGAGSMVAASILLGRALAPIDQVIVAWKAGLAAHSAYQRVEGWLSEVNMPMVRLSPSPAVARLKVEQLVVVAPSGSIPAVCGVSFELSPGECLTISGESGSGKSSLLRGILGIWPLHQGSVALDGTRWELWPAVERARHIGYLSQEPELFDGTVRDNIARFGKATDTQIQAAAKKAQVHEIILGLAQGYETRIGERGRTLSGGQRQAVALARACFDMPVLLVLDEPETGLDKAGLTRLKKMLQEHCLQGGGVILISHNPDVQALAGRELRLKEGMPVRLGPVVREPSSIPGLSMSLSARIVQGGAA